MKEKEMIFFFLFTELAVVDEVGGQRRTQKKGTKEYKRSMRSRRRARRRRDAGISEQDVAGWGGGCEPLILPIHYPPGPATNLLLRYSTHKTVLLIVFSFCPSFSTRFLLF